MKWILWEVSNSSLLILIESIHFIFIHFAFYFVWHQSCWFDLFWDKKRKQKEKKNCKTKIKQKRWEEINCKTKLKMIRIMNINNYNDDYHPNERDWDGNEVRMRRLMII